ncbi:hypothetical protein LOTGIDRAFT_219386 [Lottia gigantea]|uniref:Endothelin-converting enzyme 1 n=1 Tax=Lottia gigantea TaxID=225164 RepID=V3ZV89_LOTGI|nr:hypothetical protein LOTGIDRAFT_219386 [Lottia gigantea]ESO88297.1 hypothetical protein LOTGIDRAFT_219386 [Lottia gigantea]
MINDAIDYNINPCDNFYDFACGNWKKNHIIPEDKTSFGVIDEHFETVDITLKNALEKDIFAGEAEALIKAKTLYKSCMDLVGINNGGITSLLNFLKKMGEWPVTLTSWQESQFSLEETMSIITLYNKFTWDVLPVISMKVVPDSKMLKEHIIEFDQSSFGLPGRDYFLHDRNDSMLKAYEEVAIKVAVLMGADPSTAESDMKDMVDFEIQLANISIPAEERRDEEALYNKMTIAEMQEKYTTFNWLQYLQSVLHIDLINVTITDETKIINTAPAYFAQLSNLIGSTNKRVVSNYLCWRFIENLLNDLTPEYQELYNKFSKVVFGTGTAKPRWQKCSMYTENGLNMAAGRLFVESAFDKGSKKIILEMINKLRAAFSDQIESNIWMDDETREAARKKANALDERVGYPEEILNDTYLNNLYKNIKYNSSDYFNNILVTELQQTVDKAKLLQEQVDKSKWLFGPAFVNANYYPLSNYMEFPAAILQNRFYSKTYPRSVNFGGIGMVIGHEITHGFDDIGIQFDEYGNLKQWWTNTSIANFKKQAQCLIDQYSDFTVPEIGSKMNGINSLGENIADCGGLIQAYQAYRKWVAEKGKEEAPLPGLPFTHDQLLFINYAQSFCTNIRPEEAKQRILTERHSPNRFRIIGACQNSIDFARVFKCPEKCVMNPIKKCSVW